MEGKNSEKQGWIARGDFGAGIFLSSECFFVGSVKQTLLVCFFCVSRVWRMMQSKVTRIDLKMCSREVEAGEVTANLLNSAPTAQLFPDPVTGEFTTQYTYDNLGLWELGVREDTVCTHKCHLSRLHNVHGGVAKFKVIDVMRSSPMLAQSGGSSGKADVQGDSFAD